MSDNGWLRMIEQNPGHSAWYIERFRSMAADGHDLDGEARFVDALAPRQARILDAGCGPGRVGGRLAALGHHVVGVDIDADLIAAADRDHPDSTWITADLAELDLASVGISDGFDVIVSAGNVMPFLDPTTRSEVVKRLAAHLGPDGRVAVGFGAGRGYDFDDFFADVAKAGLRDELRLSTWDLRPFSASSDFLVAVLGH
ncbi:MAG TPA: class I SAM-dependent methyltransferase [Ilumatobacteraceae bacterium]|nr:class I SAM-dependent methyltransferase [Ilumatobacteraceae bacterium]